MGKVPTEVMNQHLSSYFHAEKKGSELISRLVEFAPSDEARQWVPVWAKEEMHHHTMWDRVMKNRRAEPGKMDYNVYKLFEITEDYVNRRSWAGSMVGAAVIEHLSNAAAAYLFHDADDDVKIVFKKITGDDLGHLDFDMHEIEKIAKTEEGRKEIAEIHKRFLMEIIEWPNREGTAEADIDILNDTYRIHRAAMKKIGVSLPKMHFSKGAGFEMKKRLIKLLA